jgi:hypothetical protein
MYGGSLRGLSIKVEGKKEPNSLGCLYRGAPQLNHCFTVRTKRDGSNSPVLRTIVGKVFDISVELARVHRDAAGTRSTEV